MQSEKQQQNLADLFAQLWRDFRDRMPAAQNAILSISSRQQIADVESAHLRKALRDKGPQALPELESWFQRCAPGGSLADERKLLVAREIDRWYGKVEWPLPHYASSALRRAWRDLVELGRFNIDAQLGQVLLRRTPTGRGTYREIDLPDTVAGLFRHLMVAPPDFEAATAPDEATAIDAARPGEAQRRVRLRFRIIDPMMRRSRPPAVPVVGIAPIAEAHDDIRISDWQQDGCHWFDIHAGDLAQQAAGLVEKLCTGGAHIIVFPEATLDSQALIEVRKAIRAHGPRSQLRFVIAGTRRLDRGGEPPLNECVIFNHRAEVLGRQCKLNRMSLDAAQRALIGLETPDIPPRARSFQWLLPGDELSIYDHGELGRFAVMIDEDLKRSAAGAWLQQDLLLDWLFMPVLNVATKSARWSELKQTQLNGAGGICRLVVANSLPASRRVRPLEHFCGAAVCFELRGPLPRFDLWTYPLAEPGPGVRLVPWKPETWPTARKFS